MSLIIRSFIVAIFVCIASMTYCQTLQTEGFPMPTTLPSLSLSSGKLSASVGSRTISFGTGSAADVLNALPESRATIEYYRLTTSGELKSPFGGAQGDTDHLVAVH